MLARTVDPREGLFMHQAHHAVLLCNALKRHHHELLMICCEVCLFENRCNFVLARGHFVVAGLDRDAEFEELSLAV